MEEVERGGQQYQKAYDGSDNGHHIGYYGEVMVFPQRLGANLIVRTVHLENVFVFSERIVQLLGGEVFI